jgi:hypothetical protein
VEGASAATRCRTCAAGNPETIRKAGLLNHDIETAEEF